MLKFLNIDIVVLTQAIENCGWTKSVNVDQNGDLDWTFATDFPTDEEIYAQIDILIPNWTYDQAVARLAQYELAVGQAEMTDTVVVGTERYVDEDTYQDAERDITEEVIISRAIDPLPETVTITRYEEGSETPIVETITNPDITKDIQERAYAQSIVDA
jgi:hypothetical protein